MFFLALMYPCTWAQHQQRKAYRLDRQWPLLVAAAAAKYVHQAYVPFFGEPAVARRFWSWLVVARPTTARWRACGGYGGEHPGEASRRIEFRASALLFFSF